LANSLLIAWILEKSKSCHTDCDPYDVGMRDIAILLFHLLATTARLARPAVRDPSSRNHCCSNTSS
jgi:hypothetical protein